MIQNVAKMLLWGVGLALMLNGCGYKELPKLKQDAEGSFKEMLMQYRLRADLVPHFIKVATSQKVSPNNQKVLDELSKAHQNAVAMDMPMDKFDEKQMFRLQSFQYELSRRLTQMITIFEKIPAIQSDGEYQSLKAQLDRIEARIAVARQDFMMKGPKYNSRLAMTPEKWFNQFLYKFKPMPVLESSN